MSRLVCFYGVGALLLFSNSGGPTCALAGRPAFEDKFVWTANKPTLRRAGSSSEFPEVSMTSLVQTRTKTRKMLSRTPEQLELWQDRHQAVEASSLDLTALHNMMQGINAQTFSAELHGLCDTDASRFVGTQGNVHMSQKIHDKFANMGLHAWKEDLDVTQPVRQYVQANSSAPVGGYGGNVIGLLKGTDLAHEVVIVGAHYDSVNWEKPGPTVGSAPGVDDNGSGSALVQLVARALVKSGILPRRSIMFVGFNAEEEGLVGSDQMAVKAARGDYGDVKAVLIADEVAYPGEDTSSLGYRKAIFETLGDVPGTDMLVDTLAHHAQVNNGDGISGFEVNHHGFGSDHISFLKRKVPSVLLIERNNIVHADTWGHSARDGYEHVNMDYGAAMTRLMLRATHALGSPASTVRNVTPHMR